MTSCATILVICLMLVGLVLKSSASPALWEQESKLVAVGEFTQANALLQDSIKSGTNSAPDVELMNREIERLRRIRYDYRLTRADAEKKLREEVKKVTPQEIEMWATNLWLDQKVIDGKTNFLSVCVPNLFFRHQELNARRTHPKDTTAIDKKLLTTMRAICEAAKQEHSPYVLPQLYHASMSVTVASNVAPNGAMIRAWLPLPRAYPFQTPAKDLGTSSTPKVSPVDSPIRAAYMEQFAQDNAPTIFTTGFDYTFSGIHFDLTDRSNTNYLVPDKSVLQFTNEAKHVYFTEKIRNLSAQIVGSQTNDLEKARAIYNWLTEHLLYSFSEEYGTLTNISESTLEKGFGDCGQQALLYITLCRYNGIPARWQTGWYTMPGDSDIHDWSEIWITGIGWMPVDVCFGNSAMVYMPSLTKEEHAELRDFYFGGLDYYRMAANSDHCQSLVPKKKFMSSDTVDFQRGEVETAKKNIYYDQFSYAFNCSVDNK